MLQREAVLFEQVISVCWCALLSGSLTPVRIDTTALPQQPVMLTNLVFDATLATAQEVYDL